MGSFLGGFWLPIAPHDFRYRLEEALSVQNTEQKSACLMGLALHDIGVNHAVSIGRKIAGQYENLEYSSVDLFIVSNSTTDYIAQALPAFGCRYGTKINVQACEFGSVVQTIANPPPELISANAILIALDHHFFFTNSGEPLFAEKLNHAIELIDYIVNTALAETNADVFLQNLVAPTDTKFGSLDRTSSGSPLALVELLNVHICNLAKKARVHLIDLSTLSLRIGLFHWSDHRLWLKARFPFALKVLPDYCDFFCRTLAAAFGRSRKLLILDLDNTLWGGILGDDGAFGVRLEKGTALGDAFLGFQKDIVELKARGIVLAIASKNEAVNVDEVFSLRSELLLKKSDFSSIRANWDDKPKNIREICDDLNLGLDSVVFCDDSSVERDFVRRVLPQVAVIELPKSPSDYAQSLAWSGFFESVSISAEDKIRSDSYASNRQRRLRQTTNINKTSFLRSLGTKLEITQEINPRSLELINKTNQFNLNLKRFTASELEAVVNVPGGIIFNGVLTDKFGPMGQIITLVGQIKDDVFVVIAWVMSCRVFNREVEAVFLSEIVEKVQLNGAKIVKVEYNAGPKNMLVPDVLRKIGFNEPASGKFEVLIEEFIQSNTLDTSVIEVV